MSRFKDRVVLISGGARGQGAAAATAFAEEGAKVFVGDVLDEEGERLAATVGGFYRRLDVRDEADWHGAVAACEREFGPVDVLFNNAGISHSAPLLETTLADFERVIDVNLGGVFLGMKTTAPSMIRGRGGVIINMSSIVAYIGSSSACAYGASKWAVRGLTKAASVELASHGIRVNSIHPGVIDTELVMTPGRTYEEVFERHRGRLLIPRLGTPSDVVPVVLFLASDEAAYITGSEFVVDGGWTAH